MTAIQVGSRSLCLVYATSKYILVGSAGVFVGAVESCCQRWPMVCDPNKKIFLLGSYTIDVGRVPAPDQSCGGTQTSKHR